VVIKAENLQRTGSFKLRGPLSKLATLDAGTPGNEHADALAKQLEAAGSVARTAG
jgi:threonine dehydratase